jgi:hypothetical protein
MAGLKRDEMIESEKFRIWPVLFFSIAELANDVKRYGKKSWYRNDSIES